MLLEDVCISFPVAWLVMLSLLKMRQAIPWVWNCTEDPCCRAMGKASSTLTVTAQTGGSVGLSLLMHEWKDG